MRHHFGHARPALASRRQTLKISGAVLVFADGNIFHLRRYDAFSGIVHLRDILALFRLARLAR